MSGHSLAQIDIAILTNLLLWQGAGQYWNTSKLFANHNALEQLTNHNTFHFSEGGPSSNPELIELFVPGWGERYCNNVNYVKNNVFFEPPSMRACSSTPPRKNQDFVKEHNRTPLIRVRTTGELGGARLPLIRHGLPWKSDLWNFGGSQKILTMCYFDVQFRFCVMWSSWIIMCKIAKISFNAWRRFKPNSLQ